MLYSNIMKNLIFKKKRGGLSLIQLESPEKHCSSEGFTLIRNCGTYLRDEIPVISYDRYEELM